MLDYTNQTDRTPDAPYRKQGGPVVIDLTPEDNEVQVAVRHPDGAVLVLTLRNHRGTLTIIGPEPAAVSGAEDSGEVKVSWWTGKAVGP